MNISLALLLFSIIVLLYWVITELFTFFFRLTGLTGERARFQVISLLTGTGFTTRESEIIMSSQHRRRLARITMLFGYVFNITIVSALVNVFLSLKLTQIGHYYFGLLIPLAAIVLIFVFLRVPAVHAWGDGLLEKLVDRMIGRTASFNTVQALDFIGSETIALVTLHHIPDEHLGVPLAKLGLKADTGILVMLVEHPGEKPTAAGAATVFTPGDKITVFGNYAVICKTFHARERFAD